MEKLYKIKEALCRELEKSETAKSGELKGGELDAIHKLTDTIKNIDKICMLENEDGGYSGAGEWEADMRGSYSGRKRDSMGRYSRDGGGGSYRSAQRGSSRSSSYSSGREEMMEHLYRMEYAAENDREREMIRRFKEQLERV